MVFLNHSMLPMPSRDKAVEILKYGLSRLVKNKQIKSLQLKLVLIKMNN